MPDTLLHLCGAVDSKFLWEKMGSYTCVVLSIQSFFGRKWDPLYNLSVHMFVRYAPTLIWVLSIQYFFGRKWDSISKCRSVVIEYLKLQYSAASEFRRTERAMEHACLRLHNTCCRKPREARSRSGCRYFPIKFQMILDFIGFCYYSVHNLQLVSLLRGFMGQSIPGEFR
jgi:hypothetical protein